MVKNPPASVWDAGTAPGPGGLHLAQSAEARAPRCWAQALAPVLRNERSPWDEAPAAATGEGPPLSRASERSHAAVTGRSARNEYIYQKKNVEGILVK